MKSHVKIAAKQSWLYAKASTTGHARTVKKWINDPELPQEIRDQDARRIERAVKRKKTRGNRTDAPVDKPMTDTEVKREVFKRRAARALGAGGLVAAVAVVPPWMAAIGDWLALGTWPVLYGGLAAHGWMSTREDETAVETPEIAAAEPMSGKPNRDEVVVLAALTAWPETAPDRKLTDLIPHAPVIDESGVLVGFDLGGTWTLPRLHKATDQVRAILAVPTGTDMQIKSGADATTAVVRVRTRQRKLDTRWQPDALGVGLGVDTGQPVQVPVNDRLLIAGMSGAGKSVALRVLAAAAWAQEHTQLVILDLKVEGTLWAHTARVEHEPDAITDTLAELIAEMRFREDVMRRRGLDTWEPTAEHPRLVVIVDEGAELLEELEEDPIAGLRSLARRARSAEMPLWWATQKPTMTGPGRGLDSAIAGQLTTRVCLAVSSPREARTVLGEDATENGWHPESLPKGGFALVDVQGEGSVPDPVRVWFMSKEDVKALPARKAWRRPKEKKLVALPDVLIAALAECSGNAGAATSGIASRLEVNEQEVNTRMRAIGVSPEPNAFAVREGVKARGYRREALEKAKNDLEEQL